jgi:anhydro-N-acetylmuramic acid kinase
MPDIFRVTGLMSGSSLDGVDLAFCEFFPGTGGWDYRIVESDTIPYGPARQRDLAEAVTWEMARIRELDNELGDYYSGLLNRFHLSIGRTPDLIASHGHTILHQPARGITFQAGNGDVMASGTGITVVSDFRREDVAQGGQGAPLVPAGDRLLFREHDACLNLGGFANISFDNTRGERIAYDVGPVNMALNQIAGYMGLPFDRNGEIAARGLVNRQILDQLNGLEYYREPPPKSLGREWFREQFEPLIARGRINDTDLMATVVEHAAVQLAGAIRHSGAGRVLVTGGGALNNTLVERLKEHANARVHIPDPPLVQYKEALVFGFLGMLRILGEINCLASVTGGKRDLSTGIIHEP